MDERRNNFGNAHLAGIARATGLTVSEVAALDRQHRLHELYDTYGLRRLTAEQLLLYRCYDTSIGPVASGSGGVPVSGREAQETVRRLAAPASAEARRAWLDYHVGILSTLPLRLD